MSMKFGKKKRTGSLLKLTKFGVAKLIFGDIRPQQYLEKQPKYGNLLRLPSLMGDVSVIKFGTEKETTQCHTWIAQLEELAFQFSNS